MRRPAVKLKPQYAEDKSFPAPVHGWIANVNLANPNARWRDGSKLQGAARLENWFPTATGIRMRGGSQKHGTVGDATNDVVSIFSYDSGSTEFLFAADEDGIYDITTPADPDTPITADVGSLTSGDWTFVQFATSGGTFLRGVNGADDSLVFDGSAWDTSPAINNVTSSQLSTCWVYQRRIFFIEADSLDAWYLDADAIGGDATALPLGGVFQRGGSLMFGAAWSLDSGSGLTEQCVFITTEGEVAVYQGSDPDDADTWRKVGLYRIGRPLGKKAFIRAGGDIVIATDIGFIPLSVAVQRDYAALSPSAVSYPIEVAWNEAVADRGDGVWNCEVWPTRQMALVTLYNEPGDTPQVFVANVRTGAWGLFTGWDAKCVHVYKERCFFGSVDGTIVEAEVTGADQGMPYTATVVPLFDPLKSSASLKVGLQARAVLRAPFRPVVKLSLQSDYVINLPVSPDEAVVAAGSVWGAGTWGASVWSTPSEKQTYMGWQSTPGQGYALSVAAQITSGGVSPPDIELVQTDLRYDRGDIVT